MEDRNINNTKKDFYSLLKFFLSKDSEYWDKHPEDFFSVYKDISEIHTTLCLEKSQQTS